MWYLQYITVSNGLYFKMHYSLKLSEDMHLKTFVYSRNSCFFFFHFLQDI